MRAHNKTAAREKKEEKRFPIFHLNLKTLGAYTVAYVVSFISESMWFFFFSSKKFEASTILIRR